MVELNGKTYDLRLRARYLPESLRKIGTNDLAMLFNSQVNTDVKNEILSEYDAAAKWVA